MKAFYNSLAKQAKLMVLNFTKSTKAILKILLRYSIIKEIMYLLISSTLDSSSRLVNFFVVLDRIGF